MITYKEEANSQKLEVRIPTQQPLISHESRKTQRKRIYLTTKHTKDTKFFCCFYYSTNQQLNHLTDSKNQLDSEPETQNSKHTSSVFSVFNKLW
jgi:hypothetical protein